MQFSPRFPATVIVRRWRIIAKLALAILLGMAGRAAFASPGCDAVNARAFTGQTATVFTRTVAAFTIGDNVSIQLTCPYCWSRGLVRATLTAGDGSTVAAGYAISYVVTGRKFDTTLTYSVDVLRGGNFVIHTLWRGTCSAVGAQPK